MSWSDGMADLTAEREVVGQAARRTLPALLVGGISYLLSAVTTTIVLSDFWSQVNVWDYFSSSEEQIEVSPAAETATTLSNIAQIGIIGVGVVFLVWFYRAVQLSVHLGLPQRRSTAWAIAGWIVPVVNLWFPYQATKDLVPPDNDELLVIVKWWWGLWIAMIPAGLLTLLASSLNAGAAWGLTVVSCGLIIGATVRAQQVVAGVDEAQGRYLDELTRP